jgi:hypothetical protein
LEFVVKIALTGAAGIGKTTLAQQLAKHFGLPLLKEDFNEVAHAFNQPQSQVDIRRKACLHWLNQREKLYNTHVSFVEDRCAIDILFRWLLANISDQNNAETHQIMLVIRTVLSQLDYVVIPPFIETTETHNHDGLPRIPSTSRLFRAQSLAIGIATQLVDKSKLILIPDACETPESTMIYVLQQIK